MDAKCKTMSAYLHSRRQSQLLLGLQSDGGNIIQQQLLVKCRCASFRWQVAVTLSTDVLLHPPWLLSAWWFLEAEPAVRTPAAWVAVQAVYKATTLR